MSYSELSDFYNDSSSPGVEIVYTDVALLSEFQRDFTLSLQLIVLYN